MVYDFFIVGGILLMAVAIRSLRRRLAFLRSGERAMGTVVKVAESEDTSDGTYYYPVYEINTRDSGTLQYKPGYTSSFIRWKTGDMAPFIFERGNPESLRPLRYWGIFGWPLGCLAVAVNLLMIGGGYYLLRGFWEG